MTWRRLRWCGIAALVIGPVATAKAETSPPSPEENLTELRERAMRANDAGRWEESMKLIRAAWELRKHYFDICSLGQVQMVTGRWTEAAASYTICRRMLPEVMITHTKLAVERDWQRVRSHVGVITVTANVPGAEVRLDGRTIGKIPLDLPIFVDPGWYAVDVRAPGYASVGNVFEMKGGSSEAWDVQLEPSKVSAAAPTRQEPAPPAPNATQEPVSPAPKTRAAPPVLAPIKDSPQGVSPTPTVSLGSRWDSQEESGKKTAPLIVAGTSLGIVGLGIASVSFVAASVAQTQADGIMVQVQGSNYEGSCLSKESVSSCREAERSVGKAFAFDAVGFGGLVISATGWALVTYELFWPSASKGKANVQGAIVMAPGGGALRVGGSF
jgi:hypothetical protein